MEELNLHFFGGNETMVQHASVQTAPNVQQQQYYANHMIADTGATRLNGLVQNTHTSPQPYFMGEMSFPQTTIVPSATPAPDTMVWPNTTTTTNNNNVLCLGNETTIPHTETGEGAAQNNGLTMNALPFSNDGGGIGMLQDTLAPNNFSSNSYYEM